MSQEQLDRIEREIIAVKHLLTGNGTPERGMIVRLDRVEQREKSRQRWLWAIATPAVAAFVGMVIDWFRARGA